MSIRYHLIIPILCSCFWAFISLWKDDFSFFGVDFQSFYWAGYYLRIDPLLIYTDIIQPPFNYLSIFAVFMIPISYLSFEQGCVVFFFLILFSNIINIVLFDKILILKKINQPSRFLFLLIISNGWIILNIYDILQTKFFIVTLILYFFYREINKEKIIGNKKYFKFYFIQTFILLLAISMLPYLIFLFIIYLLHDINKINNAKKIMLIKFLLCIVIFFLQNFLFLIYPSLLLSFLNGFNEFQLDLRIFPHIDYPVPFNFYFPYDSLENIFTFLDIYPNPTIFQMVSLSLIVISVIIISFLKKSLETKFSLFSISLLFFSITHSTLAVLVIYTYLITLALSKNIIETINIKEILKNINEIIKNNWFYLISLLGIVILSFNPPVYFIPKVIPFITIIPIKFFAIFPTFIYIILLISLLKNK